MRFHPRLPLSTRSLRLESLENRALMTATPITPAQAVAIMNQQSAVVANLATSTSNDVRASQNDLMNLDRQLASVTMQEAQSATMSGNTSAALADLQLNSNVTAAGGRINNEFNQTVATLVAAETMFHNETATLINEVVRGTITPVAAVAAQQVDVTAFKISAAAAETQSSGITQLELPNMANLTYLVEGLAGEQSLGTFHGSFDTKVASVGGTTTDLKGIATVQLTQTKSLLQGTFTGSSSDYLQAIETGTGSTPKIVNQPIVGGTLTAINSSVPHPDGYTVHGTITLSLGAVGSIPAHTQTLQFAANLSAQNFLVGVVQINGQTVGSLDLGRISA